MKIISCNKINYYILFANIHIRIFSLKSIIDNIKPDISQTINQCHKISRGKGFPKNFFIRLGLFLGMPCPYIFLCGLCGENVFLCVLGG